MNSSQSRGMPMILLTLALGLLLTIIPLPEWAIPFRPQWAVLILIYWAMALPHRIGVGSSWMLGIIVDLLTGSLLGLHALGYAIVAFFIIRLHRRIRVLPLWQQAMGIFLLLLLEHLLKIWLLGFTQLFPTDSSIWISPIISMFLWPWVYIILRGLRHRFYIS